MMDSRANKLTNFLRSSRANILIKLFIFYSIKGRSCPRRVLLSCRGEVYIYIYMIANRIGSWLVQCVRKGILMRRIHLPSQIDKGIDNCNWEMYGDMERLSHDTTSPWYSGSAINKEDFMKNSNSEAKKFFKFVEDVKQELCPGCKSF